MFIRMRARLASKIFLLLLAASTGWWASEQVREFKQQRVAVSRSGPVSVERLAELAELLTLRIDVSDVLVTRIDGYTGGVRIALLVRGDVSLGVDVSAAQFESVDPVARSAVLVLPAPRPNAPRLDHERSRVVSLETHGLWMLVPGGGGRAYAAVTEQAMADAQRLIQSAGDGPAARLRARSHTESVLGKFFQSIGWRVRFGWSEL